MKVCTKCENPKDLYKFHKDKNRRDGHSPWCKLCASKSQKESYAKDPTKKRVASKIWYTEHLEQHKAAGKRWNINNLEKFRAMKRKAANKYRKEHRNECIERDKRWAAANPDKVREGHKKWASEHPCKIKEARNKAMIKKRSTPEGRLNIRIGNGIRQSLRRGSKEGKHWEDLVGYTIDKLKRHLEKKLLPGMTWENYGEWHIDHETPIAAFNFETSDDIDFKRCWALKNLQPLWATENMKKYTKITSPFQPALAING